MLYCNDERYAKTMERQQESTKNVVAANVTTLNFIGMKGKMSSQDQVKAALFFVASIVESIN